MSKNDNMHTLEIPSQIEGIKWLSEMENLQNPYFRNLVLVNILKVSNRIDDTELVYDPYQKRILVFLKLNLDKLKDASKEKKRKNIIDDVENVIYEALPSYEIRITEDQALLDRAKKIMGIRK